MVLVHSLSLELLINRFREEVYQSIEQRGDAILELIDALTRNRVWGRFPHDRLRELLDEYQPEDTETIAGYEVYAMNCTDDWKSGMRIILVIGLGQQRGPFSGYLCNE